MSNPLLAARRYTTDHWTMVPDPQFVSRMNEAWFQRTLNRPSKPEA